MVLSTIKTKILITLLVSLSFIQFNTVKVAAHENENHKEVHVFKRDECVHCQEEKQFLQQLVTQQNDIEVIYHDIYTEPDLFEKLVTSQNLSKVTPITVIGGQVIVGFESAETTGEVIKKAINTAPYNYTLQNFFDNNSNTKQIQKGTCEENSTVPCEIPQEVNNPKEFKVKLPFIGKVVDLSNYSLPALSFVLGLIDGFNPCAMWVLLTFLVILMQLNDKKKMFVFAGFFIVAEAIMYHLILTVWFTTWDFIGLNKIVTPLVGLLAVASGIHFLYLSYKNDNECKVTDLEHKIKTKNKIKELVEQKFTIFTAIGIIFLAFSVNIIEFACSIGIPQAFTKILELQNLSFIQTEAYMLIYILGYMVDDFAVFGLALYSFEKIGLTTKYARFNNLIGGILMLILGSILIIKPEILSYF